MHIQSQIQHGKLYKALGVRTKNRFPISPQQMRYTRTRAEGWFEAASDSCSCCTFRKVLTALKNLDSAAAGLIFLDFSLEASYLGLPSGADARPGRFRGGGISDELQTVAVCKTKITAKTMQTRMRDIKMHNQSLLM